MISICYVVDAPYVGGAEHYVRRIALALDRSEFSPSLVIRAGSDDIAAWGQTMEDAGVPTTAVPMSLPFNPFHAPGLVRAMSAMSPHVVHVNLPGPYDGQMGLVCPLARMAGAGAVVTTEHLPMVEYLWKRALVKRLGYRFADRVLTVCQANVPFLTERQRVDERRVVVVPNGIRDDYGSLEVDVAQVRGRHGVAVGSALVAFVGSIERRKGLHRVIRALYGVTSSPWHLVVAGEGPDRAACESLAGELNLSERTTFAGSLATGDIERLLVSADVLVLPSLVEGMPYVILEAMAARTAVVSTRVAGIPEMVVHGETGLLVGPGDDDALRDSVDELLSDASKRDAMAAAGRKRFEERFTLQTQVDAISSLYRSLVGARQKGSP